MKRLAAFSLSALLLLFATPMHATEAEPTNWHVRISSDPFTSKVNSGAILLNQNGDVLSVACNGIGESIISIQYRPKDYLGSTNNLVMIKIGDNPPIPGILWEYTSRGAYTTSESFVSLFSKFSTSSTQKILVRAYNYENQPVDAAFLSVNAKDAVDQIMTACGAVAK